MENGVGRVLVWCKIMFETCCFIVCVSYELPEGCAQPFLVAALLIPSPPFSSLSERFIENEETATGCPPKLQPFVAAVRT